MLGPVSGWWLWRGSRTLKHLYLRRNWAVRRSRIVFCKVWSVWKREVPFFLWGYFVGPGAGGEPFKEGYCTLNTEHWLLTYDLWQRQQDSRTAGNETLDSDCRTVGQLPVTGTAGLQDCRTAMPLTAVVPTRGRRICLFVHGCVHVCVYMCVYLCISVCARVRIRAYTSVYVRMGPYMCVYVRMRPYTYVRDGPTSDSSLRFSVLRGRRALKRL